jgi:hypothetical protein
MITPRTLSVNKERAGFGLPEEGGQADDPHQTQGRLHRLRRDETVSPNETENISEHQQQASIYTEGGQPASEAGDQDEHAETSEDHSVGRGLSDISWRAKYLKFADYNAVDSSVFPGA